MLIKGTIGLKRKLEQPEIPLSGPDPGSRSHSPKIWTRLSPAVPTVVFDTYWRFAAERQRIFFSRLRGEPRPWTLDPIFESFRFTNAYRASDRVSQYLIRNVIYRDDLPSTSEELFFRIILFKLFNKIETWETLERNLGQVLWEDYSYDRYEKILESAKQQGEVIYSGAYIMPSGSSSFGSKRKHQNHLRLIEMMMSEAVPQRIAASTRMQQAFELLRSYPTLGDFLAFQFVTDLNYSTLTSFSESEFVVAGPGAKDGIRKCFADPGGLSEAELIRYVHDIQTQEFERLGLQFQDLWGRRLRLIDCQNVFCEVDKYSRIAHPSISGISGRTRIKQRFRESSQSLSVWYPPKWNLNAQIEESKENELK